jgi:hypothetical protein
LTVADGVKGVDEVGKTARMDGEVKSMNALYRESAMIVAIASRMGASLAPFGAGSGIESDMPS